MRHIAVHEHTRLYRGTGDLSTGDRLGDRLYLSDLHFRRLHQYDDQRAATSTNIFTWRHNYAIARHWVGVVQVPGLSVEVLPKVAPHDANEEADLHRFSRKNLIYMLVVAGAVPLNERDLAKQSTGNAPLLEVLIAIFADRLYFELQRGQQHAYIRRRENIPVLKGKLAFSEHLKFNMARKDRFYVEHDQYSADTPLNRILKAGCQLLFQLTSTRRTEDQLGRCLMLLDEVAEIPVQMHHFDKVLLSRKDHRFADLLEFCRLLFSNNSPTAQSGDRNTFSLLFDMNALYEKFIANFLRKYVLRDQLADCRLHAQTPPVIEHLVYGLPDNPPAPYSPRNDGKKVLRLLPDIVIVRGDQRLLIDTKWTHLSPSKSPRDGVNRGVLFQLFAYAHNYGARHNVLLYPRPRILVEEQTFDLPMHNGDNAPKSIHARFADLNRDLTSRSERAGLAEELGVLVGGMLVG